MLTQNEIARHLDMSSANLRNVLNSLKINWENTTLDEIRVAYIRDLREKAAGRGGEHQIESTLALTRKNNNQADLYELQIKEKSGELIPVNLIEPFISSQIIAARQAFEILPSRWNKEIKSLHGIEVSVDYFMDEINGALNQLSEFDLSDVSKDEAEIISEVEAY